MTRTLVIAAGLAVACDPAPRATPTAAVEETPAVAPIATTPLDRIVSEWLASPSPRRNEALLSRMLRSLGRDGAASMIGALETPGFGGEMEEAARADMEAAIVEALGRLEDPRAKPILRSSFEAGRTDAVRALAAAGLAHFCGETELALLLDHARAGDPLSSASVHGLGRCLRLPAAERLAAMLGEESDPARAAEIAQALGRIGSALVWSAPSRKSDLEGDEIRLAAATALVDLYARIDLAEARRAIDVVRHPRTADLIARARRSADAAGAARLDRIVVR